MAERTKLVVRRLPPALPEEVFWKSVAPWVAEVPPGSVLTKYFVPGKIRQKKNKHDLASRAYIQFSTVEQVVEFHRNYDEHVFKDSKGSISTAKVEFAPYQKISGLAKRADPRQGTIEQDPDYKTFLESLNDKAVPANAIDPAAAGKLEQPTTTPLIEHLRAQRRSAGKEGSGKTSKSGKKRGEPRQTTKSKKPQKQPIVTGIARRNSASRPDGTASKPPVEVAPSVISAALSKQAVSQPSPKKRSKAPKVTAPAVISEPTQSTSAHSLSTSGAKTQGAVVANKAPGDSAIRGGRNRSSRGGRGGGVGSGPASGPSNRPPVVANPPPPPPAPAPSSASVAKAKGAEIGRGKMQPRSVADDADNAGARRRLGAALAGLGGPAGERRRKKEGVAAPSPT